MKWAGMYFVGFVILVGGVMAALWKLGILARIGTTWTLIGLAIVIGKRRPSAQRFMFCPEDGERSSLSKIS